MHTRRILWSAKNSNHMPSIRVVPNCITTQIFSKHGIRSTSVTAEHFSEMQDTFARINYYDNVERKLQSAGIDVASRSEAVKGAIFSYSIQHGQTSAVNAVKAIQPKSTTSDAKFLKKLYNTERSHSSLYASR